MLSLDRRTFMAASAAATFAARQASAQPAQTFHAGLVANAPRPANAAAPRPAAPPGAAPAARPYVSYEDQTAAFLRGMDDAARLGVHYVEKTSGPDPLLWTYYGRENAFKDELDKRNLKLAGLANNCHAGQPELRAELVSQNLRTARFIKAMGGKYIALVLNPIPTLDFTGSEQAFRKLDFKVVASIVDEISRACFEECGVTVGYHNEDGDASAGLIDYLMENTKYLKFFPDVGWMQMAGMDRWELAKKYYSRVNGMHLRDFAPPTGTGNGLVPLGQGQIDLVGLMNFLRERKFTGYVMGEGVSNQSNFDYMHGALGLTF